MYFEQAFQYFQIMTTPTSTKTDLFLPITPVEFFLQGLPIRQNIELAWITVIQQHQHKEDIVNNSFDEKKRQHQYEVTILQSQSKYSFIYL